MIKSVSDPELRFGIREFLALAECVRLLRCCLVMPPLIDFSLLIDCFTAIESQPPHLIINKIITSVKK